MNKQNKSAQSHLHALQIYIRKQRGHLLHIYPSDTHTSPDHPMYHWPPNEKSTRDICHSQSPYNVKPAITHALLSRLDEISVRERGAVVPTIYGQQLGRLHSIFMGVSLNIGSRYGELPSRRVSILFKFMGGKMWNKTVHLSYLTKF